MVNIDNITDAEWRKPSNIAQHKVMRDKINEVITVVNEGGGGGTVPPELVQDVATLKTEMSVVQTEMSVVQLDVTMLKNEVPLIQADVYGLLSALNATNGSVANVQNGLDTTNDNVTALSGKVATDEELGLVKASLVDGKINVDAEGVMSMNGYTPPVPAERVKMIALDYPNQFEAKVKLTAPLTLTFTTIASKNITIFPYNSPTVPINECQENAQYLLMLKKPLPDWYNKVEMFVGWCFGGYNNSTQRPATSAGVSEKECVISSATMGITNWNNKFISGVSYIGGQTNLVMPIVFKFGNSTTSYHMYYLPVAIDSFGKLTIATTGLRLYMPYNSTNPTTYTYPINTEIILAKYIQTQWGYPITGYQLADSKDPIVSSLGYMVLNNTVF